MKLKGKIKKFINLLNTSEYVTVLTGAGASTLSGIPDFRSDKGLYTKYDPYELFGLKSFLENPEIYYKFAAGDGINMISAQPNIVHKFVAGMEKYKKIKAVITQNIDGLHETAGNLRVLNIHGNYMNSYCYVCKKNFDSLCIMENYQKSGEIPYCECGGLIKPDVIFFGESLDTETLQNSINEASQSDLMIVIGTSLSVSPANMLPVETLRNGGKIVILNKMETFMNEQAEIVFDNDFKKIFPMLKEEMKRIEQPDT